MKKVVQALAGMALCAGLSVLAVGCTNNNLSNEEAKVGFILAGSTGGETQAFKDHWESLAKEYDATVVYENFKGQDPAYYKECAEKLVAAGCNAVICNFEMDGKESVLEYCIDEEVYVGYSGSTVSDSTFKEYENSKYFLGQIAPGATEEQAQAYKMTKYFIELYYGSNAIALPAGTTDKFAVWPADFHGITLEHQMTYRWKGIKQALSEYGVTVNGDSDSDSSKWTASYSDNSILKDKVLIMGNNMADFNALIAQCSGILMQNPCAVVTTCNGDMLFNQFAKGPIFSKATRFGTIDSFVSDYDKWYVADESSPVAAFKVAHDPYLVGKFSAINEAIFALAVKAIRGQAIRDNGKAVNIIQTYWTATTKAEFDKAKEVSSKFSWGKATFDDITTVTKLQELYTNATLANLSEKIN